MEKDEIINQVKKYIKQAKKASGIRQYNISTLVEAREFLRVYAGEKSSFYKELIKLDRKGTTPNVFNSWIISVLNGFIRFLESGYADGTTIERRAQLDVVSDFLTQADDLLKSKNVHPAVPAVIIGSALEEFLRNWVEEANLEIGNRKPCIDTYVGLLRADELITKQDAKDIICWAGMRNHAAHGEWEEVNDKKRVVLMLEGVNLFMRKYIPTKEKL